MLLPFQQDWMHKNYRAWTESPLDKILYVSKADTTPEKLAVLTSWLNLDGVSYEEYGDDMLFFSKCHCGATMSGNIFSHDCFCLDCYQPMDKKKTWTPEMGYADEIYSCSRCGKRGASRSFIQTPS